MGADRGRTADLSDWIVGGLVGSSVGFDRVSSNDMRHVVPLLLAAICAPSLADDSLAHQSVAELAARLALPCVVGRRSEVEARMPADRRSPRNPSARYRLARMAFFATVVAVHWFREVAPRNSWKNFAGLALSCGGARLR